MNACNIHLRLLMSSTLDRELLAVAVQTAGQFRQAVRQLLPFGELGHGVSYLPAPRGQESPITLRVFASSADGSPLPALSESLEHLLGVVLDGQLAELRQRQASRRERGQRGAAARWSK